MTHFACQQCGRQLKWNPSLAGKRARCACGATVQCPVDPIDETHDPYELKDVVAEATTPAARQTIVARPVVEPAPLAPGEVRKLGYRNASTDQVAKTDPETLKNFYVPLYLLAGGIAIEAVAALLQHRRGVESAMLSLAAQLLGGTAVMLLAVFITAKARAIELGSFKSAALKLAAVCIAPGALGTLGGPFLRIIPLSGLVVLAGQFLLYFALLGYFFDMDESDTWYCVCVIFVINVAFYFAMLYGMPRA